MTKTCTNIIISNTVVTTILVFMRMLLSAFLEYFRYRSKADKWRKTTGKITLNYLIIWGYSNTIFSPHLTIIPDSAQDCNPLFIVETATRQTASFTDPSTSRLSPWKLVLLKTSQRTLKMKGTGSSVSCPYSNDRPSSPTQRTHNEAKASVSWHESNIYGHICAFCWIECKVTKCSVYIATEWLRCRFTTMHTIH